MPNGQPSQLANLRPPWQPGEQGKPGSKYVERMVKHGEKLAPRAIAVVGRIMEDSSMQGDLIPVSLRFRAAELIIEKTWPKAAAGTQVTVDGASSLNVTFHFPGDPPPANGHANSVTMSFDAEGE